LSLPDPDEVPLGIHEYQANDLMLSAFENRADLRSQEFNIDAASEGIRIAKAGYLPRINFSRRFFHPYVLLGILFSDVISQINWTSTSQNRSA